VPTPNQITKQQSFQNRKEEGRKTSTNHCCSAKLISPNLNFGHGHGLLKFWAFSPHRKGAQYPTVSKVRMNVSFNKNGRKNKVNMFQQIEGAMLLQIHMKRQLMQMK